MIAGRPTTRRDASTTALGSAIMRAVHQVVDGVPKIVDDPISPLFINAEELRELQLDPDVFLTPIACAMRVGVLAASRFAEDRLAEAYRRGVTQAVVLGAGGRHTHHAPNLALTAEMAQQHAEQFADVQLIAFGAAFTAVNLDTRGIHDHILHADGGQVAVQPEAIAAGLVAAQHRGVGRQAEVQLGLGYFLL